MPKPQRRQALDLQVRQWSPFANPRWYLVWDADTALVWAWDADRVEAAMRDKRLKPESTNVIPETLLQQRQKQGAYLRASLEGYEGQIWHDGALIGSRWWPEAPDGGEWLNFQRDAGAAPESHAHQTPVPLPLALLEQPWEKSAATGQVAAQGKAEQWTVMLATLCLAAATFWYGAQILKLQTAIAEHTTELDTLNQQTAAITESRSQALEALDRVKQLQALDPYPPQLSLLAKIAETLPKDGPYLREWEFQNGKLKLQIASPTKLASSDLIKQFQSFGVFNNVLATPGNEPTNLALSMEIQPQSEVKFVAESNDAPRKKDGDNPLILVPPLR